MTLHNSSSHDGSNPNRPAISVSSSILNAEQRSKLYAKMAKYLDENGAVFLPQGETSRSLSLSDIFTLKDGTVTPVLKAANPPVRANVLHLSPEYSIPISESVKSILLPYFGKAIWFQNSSMFHASHHISPVPATETETHAYDAQVVSGTDPLTIRTKLKTAIQRAPEKQLYNEVMLHTSFARLLGAPQQLARGGAKSFWTPNSPRVCKQSKQPDLGNEGNCVRTLVRGGI